MIENEKKILIDVSPIEVVCSDAITRKILWKIGKPRIEDIPQIDKGIHLLKGIGEGQYLYLQSITPQYVVVVFVPYGGLDWNLWLDIETGKILKITEAR